MKKTPILIPAFLVLTIIFMINSCSATSNLVDAKSGAQLWGENCFRCHNIPSPETFSDVEWDVAVMHMQIRANLTKSEATKIADFLKSAN